MILSLVKSWSFLKKVSTMDINAEFQNIKTQWDQHDQGVKKWKTVNAVDYSVPNAALASAVLGNGQMQIWVDEVGNNLTFKVKYSTGTVKSGTVALS